MAAPVSSVADPGTRASISRVHIRPEEPLDARAVREVNEAAFESSLEARIVERLRQTSPSLISVVAEVDKEIVGHIMFSPLTIAAGAGIQLMGLGPMAVLPAHQRQGIGSELVREGLRQCTATGCSAVLVLGHPGYYPRFGFAPASRYGITSAYDVPDEAFMLVELQPDSLQGLSGQAIYNEAFAGS